MSELTTLPAAQVQRGGDVALLLSRASLRAAALVRAAASRVTCLTLAVCTVAMPLCAQSSAQTPPTPARPAPLDTAALAGKIDELLNAHATLRDFSGAVMLAKDGTPLFAKGYGSANLEWQVPNTVSTKFRIGSLTKSFTSMLVMQLRQRGALTLEDSLCLHVSPCPDAWKAVTLQQLLTHTSGIPNYTALREFNLTNMVPRSREEMLTLLSRLPLQWTPGARFEYSNSGYWLLGLVIEKASGHSFEGALQRMILQPLGMSDTGYDSSRAIIPRRASGYVGQEPKRTHAPVIDMQAPFSAGGLYSTVEDLVRWDNALSADTLLPAGARQLMWTPVKDNYAYGWMVHPPAAGYFGYRRIAHTGTIEGFSSVFLKLPDAELTVIVLANNGSINAPGLARDILAVYFGGRYTVPAPRAIVSVDTQVLDMYVGTYELNPKFGIAVTRDGATLVIEPRGQGKIDLFAESTTAFFAKAVELTITFVEGAEGSLVLVLRQGGRELHLKRVD